MVQDDVFVIHCDNQPCIVLTNFKTVLYPDHRDILDWYAEACAMNRKRLTGFWVQKIDVGEIKFEEFGKAKP